MDIDTLTSSVQDPKEGPMEKQTKQTTKMALAAQALHENGARILELKMRAEELQAYEARTQHGKDTRDAHLQKISAEIEALQRNGDTLAAQLEVETVEMLAGINTDFVEKPAAPVNDGD